MPLNNSVLSLVIENEGSSSISKSTIPVPADITGAVQIVAANASRKGLSLWNASTGNILIEYGAAPTASAYAFKLNPNSYFELPYDYKGVIQGLWDATGGNGLYVREFS